MEEDNEEEWTLLSSNEIDEADERGEVEQQEEEEAEVLLWAAGLEDCC